MKGIVGTSALFIFLSTLVLSCSSGQTVLQAVDEDSIFIKSPMTISNNDLFPITGKHQYLRLKLVRGEYDEDWSPGPFSGTVWKGDFVIELADETGKTITETNLGRIYNNEPLIFTSHFQFEFDDYNDDGDADFTIGQYASSNGKDYKIYTVRSNGEIEELPIRGQPSLFISQNSGYSTRLEKVDPVSFKTSYYDNSAQKQVEKIFRWDGKAFVQVDGREAKR